VLVSDEFRVRMTKPRSPEIECMERKHAKEIIQEMVSYFRPADGQICKKAARERVR
jgi:hypothetical protein